MKKRKIKKGIFIKIGILIVLIIGIVFGIKFVIDTKNYQKTYEYKFLKLGYTKEEFKIIDSLKVESKDYILTIKKNKELISLTKEKYFIEKNLKKYLEYANENKNSLSDVIAIVNVGADNDFYTNTKKTDTSKKTLLLTNKFYSLDNTYNSDTMSKVSKIYSYGDNQMLITEAYNAFKEMFNAAKKENLTLIINSSYRSYEDQEKIYNEYKSLKGEKYADTIAAKPGFSEHQTGLAIDVQTYNSTAQNFETFEEFNWLQNNAYKFGFILRYPKDKKYLTGYDYESWHYRYVGTEVAKYIQENNITFDEYYAYFIEDK